MSYLKKLACTAICLAFTVLLHGESALAETSKHKGYVITPTFDDVSHDITGALLYYSIPLKSEPTITDLKGDHIKLSHVEDGCSSLHYHLSLNKEEQLVKDELIAAWYYGFTGKESDTPPASEDIPCMSDTTQSLRTYVYQLVVTAEEEHESEESELMSSLRFSEIATLVDEDELQDMLEAQIYAHIPLSDSPQADVPGVVVFGTQISKPGDGKGRGGKGAGKKNRQAPPANNNQGRRKNPPNQRNRGGADGGGDDNRDPNRAEPNTPKKVTWQDQASTPQASRVQRLLGYGKAFAHMLKRGFIVSGKTVLHVYAIGSSKYLPGSMYPKLALEGAKLIWWKENLQFYFAGDSTVTAYLNPYLEDYWETAPGQVLTTVANIAHFPFYALSLGLQTGWSYSLGALYQWKVDRDQRLADEEQARVDKKNKERKERLDKARVHRERFERLPASERISRLSAVSKDVNGTVSYISLNATVFDDVYTTRSYMDPALLYDSTNYTAIRKTIDDKRTEQKRKVRHPLNLEKIDPKYYSREHYKKQRSRVDDLLSVNPMYSQGPLPMDVMTGCSPPAGVRMLLSDYKKVVLSGELSKHDDLHTPSEEQVRAIRKWDIEAMIASTPEAELNKCGYDAVMRFQYTMKKLEKDPKKKQYHAFYWEAFTKGTSPDAPSIPKKLLDQHASGVCPQYASPIKNK